MTQIPMFEEIGDPQLRRDEDFYETARWQVEALLRRVPLDPRLLYFEPCAGEGAIATPLRELGLRVVTNDLVPRQFPLDFTMDATQVALWDRVASRYRQQVDVVVTNVPFALAFEILPTAVARARAMTISLLRSTWDEPTLERAEWLDTHPPDVQIAMPRHNYRGGDGDGDSATHHWFIWFSEQARPHLGELRHHYTVTPRERDALVAQLRLEAHGR